MKWLRNVMEGRSGTDHLSIFLYVVGFTLWVVFSFLPWRWLMWVAIIPLAIAYYRSFSTNKLKRHQENVKFLKHWYPIQSNLTNRYRGYRAKRQYRYFSCKECKQKLRVPRKAKRVQVTCPKCRHTFIKMSPSARLKSLVKK